jgi:transglutaminase-like putative cysteine protease
MICMSLLVFSAGLCATAQEKSGSTLPAPGKPAQAQSAPAAPPAKPSDPAKEGLVIEKVQTSIRFEADGTSTRQTTSRTRILADSGVKQMAVLTFTYKASNQQVEIGYVRVIKPDGKVVVTPDYNVQDMPADVTRSAPMYSDIHQKHVAVKGLGVGDTLESQVTIRTFKPEIPGHFWFEYSFEKDLILQDEELNIDLPADKSVTVASSEQQPTVTTANGRKLYHWASANLTRPDPDAPPKSTKHWKPSVQVTTFSSWEQVGAWYNSLQKEPLTVTPAIQARAAALTKGLTSDEEKLRAIFNDVALHIHYVGLEFGIGSYQPHPADDVLSNEYGDCKDKHTLLAALLKAAGIEAWPVLISSSRELDPATPSPAQFDHAITLVPLGGKLVWMDSTAEVAPVGLLLANLRDKQALAVPVGKPAYLERTSADPPFAQAMRFQSEGKLSEQGVYTGHITQSYHGDVEIILRSVFRQVAPSQLKVALQAFSQGIGFVGEISNPQISEVEQTSQPLQFSYDYTREKFGDWDDHRIYPSMPSTSWGLSPGVIVKKPADEPEIGAVGEQVYVSRITVPKGWSLYPQQDVNLTEDWAEYHATYSFKDDLFAAERRLVVKKPKVPLDQWEKYLAFRRAINQDEVRSTVLISGRDAQDFQNKIAAETAVAPTIAQGLYTGALTSEVQQKLLAAMQPLRDATSILEEDPQASPEELAKAADLSRKAAEAIDAQTLVLAEGDMHSLYWMQVLANAWCTRGWSALLSKDLLVAESYLRAAWVLSQDKSSGYQLARLLESKGEKAAAAHQYELAHVSSVGNSFGGFVFSNYKIDERIEAAYKKLTGKELTATPLNHGAYNGSLRAELDKQLEIRHFTPTSKFSGEALFAVAYEADKPVKAHFLGGEKKLAPLASTLEGHRFAVSLPAGSKARMLREVRLVCSSYGGGCDAYLLLPTSVEMPNATFAIPVHNLPKDEKTVQIQLQP